MRSDWPLMAVNRCNACTRQSAVHYPKRAGYPSHDRTVPNHIEIKPWQIREVNDLHEWCTLTPLPDSRCGLLGNNSPTSLANVFPRNPPDKLAYNIQRGILYSPCVCAESLRTAWFLATPAWLHLYSTFNLCYTEIPRTSIKKVCI